MELSIVAANELSRLPVESTVAVRLLEALDDPATSAQDLAWLIETDPALSLKVIRLANTPYYGQDDVASAWRAVTVLGFWTVQAVALSAALGLFGDSEALPEDFWSDSVALATSTSTVASYFGVPRGEAFSAGLLANIGAPLLLRTDRAGCRAAATRAQLEGCPLHVAEQRQFGASHADIGADALSILRLPGRLIEAVRCHHGRPDDAEHPLARAVTVGGLLLDEVVDTSTRHLAEEPAPPELDGVELDVLVDELARQLAATDSFAGLLAGIDAVHS